MGINAREGLRVLMSLRVDFGPMLRQSYPARVLDRRLQVDWTRDAREGPRVLMSLRSTKFRALLFLSLHSSPSSSKLFPWPPMVVSFFLTHLLLEVASPLSLPFSIPLPLIFQEAKESIDEEDPRPTSSNGAYIMWYQEHLHLGDVLLLPLSFSSVNSL
ncbi:hypothetical protein HKD37_18G050636 [Glycine soja]